MASSHCHASPNLFDRLPDDVVLLILFAAHVMCLRRYPYSQTGYAIPLGHVCHRWRVIVLNYSMFWNDLVVPDNLEVFRTLLKRSKLSPLSLSAHTSGPHKLSRVARGRNALAEESESDSEWEGCEPGPIQFALEEVLYKDEQRVRVQELDLSLCRDEFKKVLRALGLRPEIAEQEFNQEERRVSATGVSLPWPILKSLCLETVDWSPTTNLPIRLLENLPKLSYLRLKDCPPVSDAAYARPQCFPAVKKLMLYDLTLKLSVLETLGTSLEVLELQGIRLDGITYRAPCRAVFAETPWTISGYSLYNVPLEDPPPYNPKEHVVLSNLKTLVIDGRILARAIPILAALRLPLLCLVSVKVEVCCMGDKTVEEWLELTELARQIRHRIQDGTPVEHLLISVKRDFKQPQICLFGFDAQRSERMRIYLIGSMSGFREPSFSPMIEEYASLMCSTIPVHLLTSLKLCMDWLEKPGCSSKPARLAYALQGSGLKKLEVCTVESQYLEDVLLVWPHGDSERLLESGIAVFPALEKLVLVQVRFSTRLDADTKRLADILSRAAPSLEILRLSRCEGIPEGAVARLSGSAKFLIVEP
ncbi:hypothetical protein EIP91_005836 [Steccherinum ochraceum]|uniref:F-box domain-containing protein n=1 Tax=Steccherinum ochraceum TaxID=92696 RepID=A0A4R0R9G3_9APHY|nr:hypothetical protein EIP91_005836 [Steccherinum ochraceum]